MDANPMPSTPRCARPSRCGSTPGRWPLRPRNRRDSSRRRRARRGAGHAGGPGQRIAAHRLHLAVRDPGQGRPRRRPPRPCSLKVGPRSRGTHGLLDLGHGPIRGGRHVVRSAREPAQRILAIARVVGHAGDDLGMCGLDEERADPAHEGREGRGLRDRDDGGRNLRGARRGSGRGVPAGGAG